jgi:hypothetical protein
MPEIRSAAHLTGAVAARRRAGERIDLAIAVGVRRRPRAEIDYRPRVGIAVPPN